MLRSFIFALVAFFCSNFAFATDDDLGRSLEGKYCITGFDPTFCREAPYNLPGVKYVGEATIVKHIREGQISYTMTQHFPSLSILTPGGTCITPEQDFNAIGLTCDDTISFSLTSAGSEAPSINTYKIKRGKLDGKWTYQGDFRVGEETLTKVSSNFNCPTQP